MFLAIWRKADQVKVEVFEAEAEAYDLAEMVSGKSGHSAYVAELIAEIEPTS